MHISVDPLVQPPLALITAGERPDPIAGHRLQIMAEPRHAQNVLKLRRKTGIGVRFVFVIQLRLLARLRGKECREVATLAVHQGNETQIAEFLLAAIGDRHFRRALESDIAFIRVGQPADISVLRLEEREWKAIDSQKGTMQARQALVPVYAIRGKNVYEPIHMDRP